ncbi:hypothetical protein RIF29_12577 [Crotalaria pallida]|uniref:RRM domain-containing protein n=1 Tax=Crotalaria pallida TaxID=3830 RepID=A0AAN9P1A1_CROPI
MLEREREGRRFRVIDKGKEGAVTIERIHPASRHIRSFDHGAYNAMLKKCESFFFSNFPSEYGVSEMWKVFSLKGSVGEVVIPPNRDKVGRRFGFVRFKDVNDVGALERNLRSVWIDDTRVQVNRPKYERGPGAKPTKPGIDKPPNRASG